MNDDQVWKSEERLWLEGAAAYEDLLHPECVMAFSPPVGIMQGIKIAESIRHAPRWKSVTMTRRSVCRSKGVIVLAYHARGERDTGDPYLAYCTSTYVQREDGWQIVQHQQTPAEI